jgi:hypothetical protein
MSAHGALQKFPTGSWTGGQSIKIVRQPDRKQPGKPEKPTDLCSLGQPLYDCLDRVEVR